MRLRMKKGWEAEPGEILVLMLLYAFKLPFFYYVTLLSINSEKDSGLGNYSRHIS